MKKFKALISLTILLTLILGLTSCNSKKNTEALKGTTLKIIATSEDYKPLFDEFTANTGIKIETLSLSSGEVLSRTKAEGGKPMADVWFGGGIDAFIQAKEDGLLEKYVSPEYKDIPAEYKDADGQWIIKGLTIVGFIVNKDVLEEKNLTMPKTWEDLTKPEYKGEIIMSNPAISGTNYGVLAGLLQKMGEEKGWEYFKQLNENIPFYGKRGKDPQQKTVAGEAAIGITYIDKSIMKLKDEQNVEIIFPEDGMPWAPEGVAIFKNADNLDAAKVFIDWIFSKETMQKVAEIEGKDGAQIVKPGVTGVGFNAPKDKLLKEDMSAFGSVRSSTLEKWNALVGDK